MPQVCGDDRMSLIRTGSVVSEFRCPKYMDFCVGPCGQSCSLIQRPSLLSYHVFGRTPSIRYTEYAGSFSTPVSLPFSHLSHHRRASCKKPMRGSGTAKCGYLCTQGPTMPLTGADRFSTNCGTAFLYESPQPPTASVAAVIAL